MLRSTAARGRNHRFATIIFGAHTVRAPVARQAVDGVTGATLTGFGLKLGISS